MRCSRGASCFSKENNTHALKPISTRCSTNGRLLRKSTISRRNSSKWLERGSFYRQELAEALRLNPALIAVRLELAQNFLQANAWQARPGLAQ